MEDYIEIFLYILLTIAFIVVGSLNKKRKKSNQFTQTDGIDDEPANINEPKNIFDYFEKQLTNTFVTEVVDNQSAPAYYEEPKIVDDVAPEMVENVEQQVIVKEDKKDVKVNSELMQDFDLRKAIIYSEILKRKSY